MVMNVVNTTTQERRSNMTNEMIISESQSLYSDIDCCITELLKARTEHNSENEGKALFKMGSLMVPTLQHLACIIEQPSLPSNLDEAAEKYSESILANNEDLQDAIEDAFIAGAEWMAGQGKSIVAKIGLATEEICCTISEETLDSLGVLADDEIILQIRKKQ